MGQPLGDLECKIDADGEILLRGVPVMRGYHNLPEETAAAFTEDGFFRTGDIGELDADGYLKITDRKKDLVKTSGGKYIAPSHIEGDVQGDLPVHLAGGRDRPGAQLLHDAGHARPRRDRRAGPTGGPLDGQVVRGDRRLARGARRWSPATSKELNTKLNRWETIKKFTILPRDLTIEDGEMTPSLKIKRRGVETNFAGRDRQDVRGHARRDLTPGSWMPAPIGGRRHFRARLSARPGHRPARLGARPGHRLGWCSAPCSVCSATTASRSSRRSSAHTRVSTATTATQTAARIANAASAGTCATTGMSTPSSTTAPAGSS